MKYFMSHYCQKSPVLLLTVLQNQLKGFVPIWVFLLLGILISLRCSHSIFCRHISVLLQQYSLFHKRENVHNNSTLCVRSCGRIPKESQPMSVHYLHTSYHQRYSKLEKLCSDVGSAKKCAGHLFLSATEENTILK